MPASAQPWVEKYRPRSVGDVSHQGAVTAALEKAVESHSLPHLLFYGPPGTGKTTLAMAVCRSMFGSAYASRVLELNASDERGISVVRNAVKTFAAQAVGTSGEERNMPPFKVIVLDECDAMTEDAQNALRRTMENFSKVTRFILCCNYISRVIDPLASRCAKFRFQPLPTQAMADRLEHIARLENIATPLKAEVVDALQMVAQGDMRRAITTMQSATLVCAATQGAMRKRRREEDGGEPMDTAADDAAPKLVVLDRAAVLEVAGRVDDGTIGHLVRLCAAGSAPPPAPKEGDGNKPSAPPFADVQRFANTFVSSGHPVPQLLSQFIDVLVGSDAELDAETQDVLRAVDDATKAKWLGHVAAADAGLVGGGDELLQLVSLMAACRGEAPPELRGVVAAKAVAAK